MKKNFKYFITIILFIFSFYYTKIVSDFIKNKDPIMIKIKENKNKLDKKPINAIIKNETIILGSKGKIIDVNKSYIKMKKINKYDESLLVYKEIQPDISITNNQNKLIVKGNNSINNITILLKINNIDLLKKIKDSNINIILESNFIDQNIEYLNQINNNIVILEQKDNISDRVNYCFILETYNNYCNKYNLLTIKPNIITHNYYYNTYQNIENGSIFAYNIINNNNLNEINNIISALKNLNYKIVSLDDFINT